MRNPIPHRSIAAGQLVRMIAILMIGSPLVSFVAAQDPPSKTKFDALSRFGKALQASTSTKQPPLDDIKLNDKSASPLKVKAPIENEPISDKLNSQRLKSIYDKMDLMKKLMAEEKRQAAKNSNGRQASNATVEIGSTTNDSIAPSKSTPGPFDPVDSADSNPSDSELPQPLNPSNPMEPGPAIGSGTPIVTKPVNSIELANSLFRTGNFAASRKSFEASLKSDLAPAQTAWLKCFIGCCYRMEGNFEQAEFTFREVTNSKDGYYPVDFAKWSLGYIAQRRATLERYALIESEIDGILKKVQSHGK